MLAAVVIWLAAGKDVFSSILLMLASAFEIVSIVPRMWKEWKHAGRKT